MAYYVFDDANCKFESWTKEQIIAAITNEMETRSVGDVDTGFVTTIKEQNHNVGLKFWRGTKAEFNAIVTPDADTYYIVTDDDTVEQLQADMAALESTVNGDISSLQGEVDAVEARMTTAETNITNLTHGTADLFNEVDEEITALQGRATSLETRATTAETNIRNLTTGTADLFNEVDEEITALQGRMTTAESTIARRCKQLWTGAVSGSNMKGTGDTITVEMPGGGYQTFAIKIICPALQKRIMLFAGVVSIPTTEDVYTISGSNGFYDGTTSAPLNGYFSMYRAASGTANVYHISKCCFIGKDSSNNDVEVPAYVYGIFGIF